MRPWERATFKNVSQSGSDVKLLEKLSSLNKLVQKKTAQKRRCLKILLDCIMISFDTQNRTFCPVRYSISLKVGFHLPNDFLRQTNGTGSTDIVVWWQQTTYSILCICDLGILFCFVIDKRIYSTSPRYG